MSDKFEKVNDILDTSTKAAGLVGVIAWAGMAVCWCGAMVVGMIRDHRQKKRQAIYDEGYEAGKEQASHEIESLKTHNDILLRDAIARTEGAAE